MGRSLWEAWYSRKQMLEAADDMGDPDQKFKLNSGGHGVANDHDKIKHELFDVLWDRYNEEMRHFVDGIAMRDAEVKKYLAHLDSSKQPSEFEEPRHPSDVDEVVPPSADKGHSEGFGGDE